MRTIRDEAAALLSELTSLRRHLHAHPEPSNEERETAALVAERLRALDLRPDTDVAGHGVVADVRLGEGPLVMLRADMDAIAVEDATVEPHRSQRPGVAHACGHDFHVATLVGAATLLVRNAGHGHPGFRFVFQPAEEATPGGATRMVAAGVLDGVWAALCIHAEPALPPGRVGLRGGPMTASADVYRIEIEGSGGHSARPHQATDAIAAATAVLQTIYALRGRVVDPIRPAIVNAGFLSAGSAPNAIAARCEIAGTVRCTDPEVRARLRGELERAVVAAAASANADARVSFSLGAPPLRNDERLADIAREAMVEVLGPEAIVSLRDPEMGAEDFGTYGSLVPALLLRVGTALPSGFVPLHSGHFDVNDEALTTAVAALTATAIKVAEAGPAG